MTLAKLILVALAAALVAAPVQRPAAQGFEEVTFTSARVTPTGQVIELFTRSAPRFAEILPGGVRLELVAVPGGAFQMGTATADVAFVLEEYRRAGFSGEDGAESVEAEAPRHAVRVETFLMGQFEVTQAQWRAVASLPRLARDLDPGPAEDEGDALPVEDVSWDDAVEFCARLSRLTGRDYRLPSEAEWEYACRAGSDDFFHFGQTVTPDLVNYAGDRPFGRVGYGFYREATTPVGSLGLTNAFGLYDMHGNVAEWCLDAWHPSYRGAPADGSAWSDAGNGKRRVVRGGSFNSTAVDCRSAARLGQRRDDAEGDVGFRVVLAKEL